MPGSLGGPQALLETPGTEASKGRSTPENLYLGLIKELRDGESCRRPNARSLLFLLTVWEVQRISAEHCVLSACLEFFCLVRVSAILDRSSQKD